MSIRQHRVPDEVPFPKITGPSRHGSSASEKRVVTLTFARPTDAELFIRFMKSDGWPAFGDFVDSQP